MMLSKAEPIFLGSVTVGAADASFSLCLGDDNIWVIFCRPSRLANDLDGHDDNDKDDCFEGGPMTREEAEAFEALPAFSAILAMRDWDDKAKVRPSSSPSSSP